jgi:hypothetical protein
MSNLEKRTHRGVGQEGRCHRDYVPSYCRVEIMEEIAAGGKWGVIVDKPLARNMK